MDNFPDNIGQLILQLRQEYLTSLKREIERVGLVEVTPTMTRLLVPLREEGVVTVNELASLAGLNKSTTTLLLNQMYDIGLVEKTGDADDKRIVRVSLTEKGKTKMSKIEEALSEISSKALDGVTPDEQANVKQGLYKIISNLLKK